MTKRIKITPVIQECLECGISFSGYEQAKPKCSDCHNKTVIKRLVKSEENKTDLI